jgi:hypothetical protein
VGPICVDVNQGFKYTTDDSDDGPALRCNPGNVQEYTALATSRHLITSGYNSTGRDPCYPAASDLHVRATAAGNSTENTRATSKTHVEAPSSPKS